MAARIKKWRECFKVVRRIEGGKLVSWQCNYLPSQVCLRYEPGKLIRPIWKGSPIFVFETLSKAWNYITPMPNVEIWRSETPDELKLYPVEQPAYFHIEPAQTYRSWSAFPAHLDYYLGVHSLRLLERVLWYDSKCLVQISTRVELPD